MEAGKGRGEIEAVPGKTPESNHPNPDPINRGAGKGRGGIQPVPVSFFTLLYSISSITVPLLHRICFCCLHFISVSAASNMESAYLLAAARFCSLFLLLVSAFYGLNHYLCYSFYFVSVVHYF